MCGRSARTALRSLVMSPRSARRCWPSTALPVSVGLSSALHITQVVVQLRPAPALTATDRLLCGQSLESSHETGRYVQATPLRGSCLAPSSATPYGASSAGAKPVSVGLAPQSSQFSRVNPCGVCAPLCELLRNTDGKNVSFRKLFPTFPSCGNCGKVKTSDKKTVFF